MFAPKLIFCYTGKILEHTLPARMVALIIYGVSLVALGYL